MTDFNPLRKLPGPAGFKKGDVFVLFGEVFGRGYVNGLLDKAKSLEMTIIGATVGRRDENKKLRALNAEELQQAEANLGGEIINVPLEAGFDLDAPEGMPSPVDQLQVVKISDWQNFQLDWEKIEKAKEVGIQRFENFLQEFVSQLEKKIPAGANVHFAHTMAGGIPRAKVLMPIANRVFKGVGKRYLSSQSYWESSIGQLCAENFLEVTARTFSHLINATENIREKQKSQGGEVRYSAYGYHGTEALFQGKYQWQTYTPYKQGEAKILMETIAREAWEKGVRCVAYNCPEIRTNSSDIFAGVELSLFLLLPALEKEGASKEAEKQYKICQEKLNDDIKLSDIICQIEEYQINSVIKKFCIYDKWPMDNSQELAEFMVGTSDAITNMHKSRKDLISDQLSSLILESTGRLMIDYAWAPDAPVVWLGHDIIAKDFARL